MLSHDVFTTVLSIVYTVKTEFDWLYEFHLLNSAFSYVHTYEVANTILIENTMFTFCCKHVYYVPNGKYRCICTIH